MDKRAILLISLLVIGAVVLFFVGPISQDPCYHDFADQRTVWGIPHFGDLITNIPFVIVGAMGLSWMFRYRHAGPGSHFEHRWEKRAYWMFFGGLLLTGFGSAWYHWNPNDQTLFWDRLPLTIAFMSIFSAVIAERTSPDWGRKLLYPMAAFGALSIIYWQVGVQASIAHGPGAIAGTPQPMDDLRPYALVQFYPMLAIPLMLLMYRSRYTHGHFMWYLMGCYGVAKICEALDKQIWDLNGVISGHNIKHVAAAAAPYVLLVMLKRRRAKG